jgi:hypothetical protein
MQVLRCPAPPQSAGASQGAAYAPPLKLAPVLVGGPRAEPPGAVLSYPISPLPCDSPAVGTRLPASRHWADDRTTQADAMCLFMLLPLCR